MCVKYIIDRYIPYNHHQLATCIQMYTQTHIECILYWSYFRDWNTYNIILYIEWKNGDFEHTYVSTIRI